MVECSLGKAEVTGSIPVGSSIKLVTMYFLAKREKGEYYELFSGKKLEKEEQPKDGFLVQNFDTPYVEKAEPLKMYLKNPNKTKMLN